MKKGQRVHVTSLLFFCEQMFPAAEKIRSAGVDEAGMHRKEAERHSHK